MKFYETKLSNGLTVIGEQKESAVSVALGFFVCTGSRDEWEDVSGVSHFLEHMMFKGTEKRTALDIVYQLGAIGAQANAYTSSENTVYFVAVLPEYLDDAFELLSDMLRPSLDAGEYELERKVILEEIALYLDRPHHVLFEAAMKKYFGVHPAGNSVLGTIESISALKREQMLEYFSARYNASNIVLVATGDFNWEHICELANKYCSHWDSVDTKRNRPIHEPIVSEETLYREDLQKAHLCLISAGPSATEDSRYASEVLSCILGDSIGSRTYWNLIDKGLADAASVSAETMDGIGIIYGYASSSLEQIERVGDVLSDIMKTAHKFSDEQMERAITKLATRTVLEGESSMHRLMAVGSDWAYRKEYVSLENELKNIKKVDRDAINSLLEKYSFKPISKIILRTSA